MSNFELVQKYGTTVFVIYKFLEENPNARLAELEAATGLSDRSIKTALNILVDVKLVSRFRVTFERMKLGASSGYRYTTIQ